MSFLFPTASVKFPHERALPGCSPADKIASISVLAEVFEQDVGGHREAKSERFTLCSSISIDTKQYFRAWSTPLQAATHVHAII